MLVLNLCWPFGGFQSFAGIDGVTRVSVRVRVSIEGILWYWLGQSPLLIPYLIGAMPGEEGVARRISQRGEPGDPTRREFFPATNDGEGHCSAKSNAG